MEIARIIFILTLFVMGVGGGFAYGIYSGWRENSTFEFVREATAQATIAVNSVYESAQSTADQAALHRVSLRGRTPGVGINTAPDQDSLVLLTGFFENGPGMKLLRRDGTTVAEWTALYYDVFPDPQHMYRPPFNNFHIDLHGSLIDPDGSVVFNFEYGGSVKMDRCGEVLWTVERPTHHSIEPREAGGYWIVGGFDRFDIEATEFFPLSASRPAGSKIREDTVMAVSADGEILVERSVPEILWGSGMEAVFSATGLNFDINTFEDQEVIHLNDITELSSDLADAFPMFEAGDLAMSLRDYNLIVVVDPDDWRVKWYQTGPWVRQHDPEFNPTGQITIFNNNLYWLGGGGTPMGEVTRGSNIIAVDPATGETEILFGDREGEAFRTTVRGKHERTPAGGFILTSHLDALALEFNADREIVWTYVNAIDERSAIKLTDAQVHAADYFTVTDWSCPVAAN
ncbi:MAG: arylsulfotransferase family protein [Pseudomonadota bacterium]